MTTYHAQGSSVISHSRHVGPAIRRLRDAKGLKQKELAALAGIHPNALLDIEKERSEPKRETLEAIAAALGVEITVIEDEAERDPLVVREPPTPYPEPRVVDVDLEGHPVMNDVEAILAWIPDEMSTRWTGSVGVADRLAEIYAYGGIKGWSADRMAYVHNVRQAVLAIQRRQDPSSS